MIKESNHKFDKTILRAYDIRGILGVTLSNKDAYFIGTSFGTVLKNKFSGKRVCVGYDGRLSSPELSKNLIQGLFLTGLEIIEIGCVPSPMLYYSVYSEGADAGIMITGSHNPPDYNGFKFIMPNRVFFGDDILELGEISERGIFIEGESTRIKKNLEESYVSKLIKNIPFPDKIKIAWDPGNGAASNIISRLILQLPGKHYLINSVIDGTFPNHHPDPTVEKNLFQLKEVVRKNECDIGFAFDGDGDRLGVIDGKGRVIWGDQILAILSKDVLRKNPGSKVIGDVKCSSVFFDEVKKLGGHPIMWSSGHSLIKAKMMEEGALLGGEMSAHIFFSDEYFGFDDAIYASLRVLKTIYNEKKSINQIYDELPKMLNTKEIRIECSENEKFEIVNTIKNKLESQGADILDIDGIRFNCNNGWWLLRASNTQACLTLRCEADNETSLKEIKSDLIKILNDNKIDIELRDLY
ncbi:MAG: Phosphomannomutase/phosphoglucomutase [Alphaproteobacteria bacterium MarineAlpha2_Bin1]|nr:MAG: Phosphomannomutase/phosphoglucomutase [Alphaproteobacteria bacterium MarineAlpha2_Bin1]